MTEQGLEIPEEVRNRIVSIGSSVSSDDIAVYGKYQEITDRSTKLHTILQAWERQHREERRMRQNYAKCLLVALFVQMALVNIAFFALGFRWIAVEQWVANSFILAVFSEVSAMSFFVVKYLFPKVSSDVLATVEKL